MRKYAVLFMAFMFLSMVLPAGAITFADLRSMAPAGTFLEPGQPAEVSESSYKSENISIVISKQRVRDTDVFVADIYLASAKYFKRGLSHDQWGANAESPSTLAVRSKAILAMTGDYSSLFSKGLAVANGEVLRKTSNALRDNCIIYPDGSMVTFKRGLMDVKAVIKQDIWQSFLFGPALLKSDGSPYDKFSSNIGVANPRSVIGYFAPGHFCFVLVEGRQANQKGLALVPLSNLMSELGCVSAYNLDGGQSAMLWFNGQLVNNPYNGGRALTDIACIGE
jgi:exopolysaccharide biosynthesis protein